MLDRAEICKLFRESLQDNRTGKYSHAKVIAMCGFLASTIFIWKLIILNTLGIDYFIAYLMYCTGTQTINKWLDSRGKGNKED